ncbi:MAG: hypothetical protein ACI90V_006531, partial [Bacillariaceae sp.]
CTLRAQQKLSAKVSRIEIMHYVQFNSVCYGVCMM